MVNIISEQVLISKNRTTLLIPIPAEELSVLGKKLDDIPLLFMEYRLINTNEWKFRKLINISESQLSEYSTIWLSFSS
jgi:hypothetical protein